MILFNWSDNFILGIDGIDKQHKQLVDLINELHATVQSGKPEGSTGKVIDGLVAYTRVHFSFEERFLKQCDYPEFSSHKSEHDRLVSQVAEMKKKYYEGDTNLSTDLAILMNDWLAEHILVKDKMYAVYLRTIKYKIPREIEHDDEACVGIKEMDDQHAKIIQLFSLIVKAKEDESKNKLMDNVSELIDHWEKHFKYEEDLMEQYDYSGFAEHKKEHDDTMDNISNLKKMYSKGFKYVISTLALSLNLWIEEHIKHIKGEDKKLGEFLKSKGVT